MFCPECGKPLARDSTPAEPSADEISNAGLEPSTNSEVFPVGEAPASPIKVEGAAAALETGANVTDKPDEPGLAPGKRERTKERLQRASTAARGAIEDNVKRVEKIHHVSTAMFEEAHYDPSLRFVLVALGLFIVAVILLVLSKVMG
jgi:hypothetical protein